MAGVIYDPEERLLRCPHCSETEPSPGADDFSVHLETMFRFAREHLLGCPSRPDVIEAVKDRIADEWERKAMDA